MLRYITVKNTCMLDGQSALFFNYVSSKCLNQVSLITISFSTPFPDNHTTIVNWDCAKDKKILCSHASVKWSEIKQKVIEKCDPSKTVRMQHFIKVKTTTNEDKEVTKVTATETNRSIQFILNFIDQLVSKMINHRDHLQVFDTQSSSKCWCCLPGCWFSRKLEYLCEVWATESALVPWARLLLDLHHFNWWFFLLTLQ